MHYITPEQTIILDELKQNKFLRSRFYFTGGTALSSIYLQHRYSDDLDFFSQEKFDNEVIFTLMEKFGKKHNFSLKKDLSSAIGKVSKSCNRSGFDKTPFFCLD